MMLLMVKHKLGRLGKDAVKNKEPNIRAKLPVQCQTSKKWMRSQNLTRLQFDDLDGCQLPCGDVSSLKDKQQRVESHRPLSENTQRSSADRCLASPNTCLGGHLSIWRVVKTVFGTSKTQRLKSAQSWLIQKSFNYGSTARALVLGRMPSLGL